MTPGERAAPSAVCLIGLRGAGKSAAGRRVAAATGRAFLDLDAALEEASGRTIRALIEDEGLAGFRAREASLLRDTLAARGPAGAVIATGGGVVEQPQSVAALARACTIYLAAPPEVLAARVAADPTDRPPLAPGGPLAEARALLARRDPLYRAAAQHVLDAARPLDEVVADLVRIVGSGAASR